MPFVTLVVAGSLRFAEPRNVAFDELVLARRLIERIGDCLAAVSLVQEGHCVRGLPLHVSSNETPLDGS